MRFFTPARSAAALLALFAAACSDAPTATPDLEPGRAGGSVRTEGALLVAPSYSLSARTDYSYPQQFCGTADVRDLVVNNTIVGKVTTTNNASTLYVKYETVEPYFISDTRLFVGRAVRDIPRDHRGWADPWSFPYAGDHEPAVRSWHYTIPFRDYGFTAGEEIVISAMAGEVHPITSDWSGAWEWKIAWARGERVHPNRAREQYYRYRIQSCALTPPPPPPPGGPGFVTLTFDDARETAYTNGYRILREFGLTANIAVNAQPIDGSWTTYMTLAQLREVSTAGWAIVNHTVSHRDMTTLSDAELEREVVENKAWIERNGFRGSHVFVVPFHSWTQRELAVVKRHASAMRGLSVTQFGPDSMVAYPPPDPYALTGYEPEFAPYTTPEGRARTVALAERAVREGKFIDIFFHEIPDADAPAFRELIRMLAPLTANVRTYDQLFPRPVLAGG